MIFKIRKKNIITHDNVSKRTSPHFDTICNPLEYNLSKYSNLNRLADTELLLNHYFYSHSTYICSIHNSNDKLNVTCKLDKHEVEHILVQVLWGIFLVD